MADQIAEPLPVAPPEPETRKKQLFDLVGTLEESEIDKLIGFAKAIKSPGIQAGENKQAAARGDSIFWIVLLLLIAGLAVLTYTNLNPPGINLISITNATMMIGLAGAVAVAIERIIEGVWSFVSLIAKNQWPLSTTLGEKTQNLNAVIDKVENIVKQIQHDEPAILNAKGKVATALTDFQANTSYLKTASVSDPKVQQVATKALAAAHTLQTLDTRFSPALAEIDPVLSGVSSFADTFKDNPGRRLLSILLGVVLGLIFTLITGVDLFKAVLGSTIPGSVALTGITIGLGASPTHEVIQLLTQLKQSKPG